MTNPPFFPGTRLAAYLRDSGGNEQDLSIERQRNEISAWAAQYGLVISGWYEDAARSGTTTAGRDRFLEMVNTIQPPTAGVVIWEFARLARQYDDITFHIADLRRRGFAVHSIVDNIPNTLEGRLFESFLASYFAEGFTNSCVYAQSTAQPKLEAADRGYGIWQAFPRDDQAVSIIQDGRWKILPNPVDWVIRPHLAKPLGVRRCPANGVSVLLMSPPRDCFAVLTPFEAEPHRSLYLSLFGKDLKAGETARALARLMIASNLADTEIVSACENYLREISSK